MTGLLENRLLTLDDLKVPLVVGGTARKAKLTVERDGTLQLLAARDVTTEELNQFLVSKRKWIYTKLAEKRQLQGASRERELVSGETFQYLGRNYRLEIMEGDNDNVRLMNGRLQIPRNLVPSGAKAIASWYSASGATWVARRASDLALRLRVNPKAVRVVDLGHRWGSASADGTIRLHWATFQMAPPLVDYIVAHELTHLREPHHGSTFWQVLRMAMPDCGERKAQVARVGAALWLGE